MRNRMLSGAATLAAIALLIALPAAADHHEKKSDQAGHPDHEAMMAEWMKYAQPGEHHEHFKMFEGKWTAESKFWTAPGVEPQVSKGTAESKLILGGRFLTTTYRGDYMGQPFEGMGISGYDNYQKKHTDIWMDNMGTLIMPSEGHCEEGGKVVKMTARFPNPATGEMDAMRMVTRVLGKDRFIWEGYAKGPDGKEYKNMEITYTRQ